MERILGGMAADLPRRNTEGQPTFTTIGKRQPILSRKKARISSALGVKNMADIPLIGI
ncbi:MAG: hypothetical protein IBX69_19245 [Anaerolineales bacterium]|nr:hypothetical protein [Anaerolineales bacterium]